MIPPHIAQLPLKATDCHPQWLPMTVMLPVFNIHTIDRLTQGHMVYILHYMTAASPVCPTRISAYLSLAVLPFCADFA